MTSRSTDIDPVINHLEHGDQRSPSNKDRFLKWIYSMSDETNCAPTGMSQCPKCSRWRYRRHIETCTGPTDLTAANIIIWSFLGLVALALFIGYQLN